MFPRAVTVAVRYGTLLRTACDVGCNAQRTTQSCTRNETKLQRNETKLQRVATSCVATKLQRVATSTTPTQVRHKSFLSRRRAALVATICSLLRDKTEKQTHDVSVGLLTQYVSLLREVCFCVSPRCAISMPLLPRQPLDCLYVGPARNLESVPFAPMVTLWEVRPRRNPRARGRIHPTGRVRSLAYMAPILEGHGLVAPRASRRSAERSRIPVEFRVETRAPPIVCCTTEFIWHHFARRQ